MGVRKLKTEKGNAEAQQRLQGAVPTPGDGAQGDSGLTGPGR